MGENWGPVLLRRRTFCLVYALRRISARLLALSPNSALPRALQVSVLESN